MIKTTQEILLLVLGKDRDGGLREMLSGNAAFQERRFSCTVLKSHKSPQKISEGSVSAHPEDWRYVTKSCAGEFKEDAQVIKNSCKD